MNLKFNQEVSKHGKKDAVIALCFFVFMLLSSLVPGIIMRASGVGFQLDHLSLLIFFAVNLAVALAIILIKYKNIASIGLGKKKIGSALRLGFAFSLIPIAISVALGLINGWGANPLGSVVLILLMFLFYAACEDIIFIGFIQTRLYGLFKTDKVAIFVGGALFTLIHIPIRLVANGFSVVEFMTIPFWFFMYVVMVSLFKRHFSLFAVTIFHTSHNFWATNQLWESGWGMTAWVSFGVVVAIESIWQWHLKRREGKRDMPHKTVEG